MLSLRFNLMASRVKSSSFFRGLNSPDSGLLTPSVLGKWLPPTFHLLRRQIDPGQNPDAHL